MQDTSALYKLIYSSHNYYTETRVVIADEDAVITTADAENGYDEDVLISVKTTKRVFSGNKPEVGGCICGEINLSMHKPNVEIQRMAQIHVFIRLVSTANAGTSEWIRKGIFFVDTRDNTNNNDNLDILNIHGYDAMMKTNVEYGDSTLTFPAVDTTFVADVASKIGVSTDSDSMLYLDESYSIPYPAQYTMREALSFIAMMYGGNWVINDCGELEFIPLWALPVETALLTDELGNRLVFGEDPPWEEVRILL